MNIHSDTHQKIMSAYHLLQEDIMSISAFENIRTIVKGIHPDIDRKLEVCSKALSKLQKIEAGDVITLSVEGFPEDTEEKKKRKKALVFFINSLKDLKSEINRVEKEFAHANKNARSSSQNQLNSWGKIIGFAKGPFGMITLIAVVIVGSMVLINGGKSSKIERAAPNPDSQKSTIKAIEFRGKIIPLSEVALRNGSDCDSKHYHALDHIAAKALDGTIVSDPGGCGFGKVKDVQVVEVKVSISPSH